MVRKGSAIDAHAATNTTSVYTAAQIFPMLPEQLSTDLTSLGEGVERLALIIDMTVASDGSVVAGDIYRAVVVNKAKLAYNSLAAWLEGTAAVPQTFAATKGLDENLRLQDRLRKYAIGEARSLLRAAGWVPVADWTDDQEYFSMILAVNDAVCGCRFSQGSDRLGLPKANIIAA